MAVIKIAEMKNGVPLRMDLDKIRNRHGLISGDSGSGKTYCTEYLCMQWCKAKSPVLVLDYSGSFKRNQLEEPLREMEDIGVLRREVIYTNGLSVNPALPQMKDVEENILEKKADTIMRVADILKKALNLTAVQKNIVYRIISDIYAGRELDSFNYILENIIQKLLEEQEAGMNSIYAGANGIHILNKMQALTDQKIFLNEQEVYWEKMQDGAITLMDFSYFEASIQQALIEAVLWDFWNYWTNNGKRRNIMVLLDEFQLLEFGKGSVLELILTQGRKHGINLWLATQAIVGNFDKKQQKNLSQVATRIIFKPSEEDIKMLRDSYGKNAERFSGMRRGECFIDSEVLGFSGETVSIKTFAVIPKIY